MIGLAETIRRHNSTLAEDRLADAAPAMLEALRECITDPGACCMNTGQKTRRLAAIDAIARAAIAAAEGESST